MIHPLSVQPFGDTRVKRAHILQGNHVTKKKYPIDTLLDCIESMFCYNFL